MWRWEILLPFFTCIPFFKEDPAEMDAASILLMAAPAAFALLVLWREDLLPRPKDVLLCGVVLAAAFLVRAAFLRYETLDYLDFLSRWVQHFRDNGGFAALKENVGNYNIPYLFFLACISYLPFDDLLLIKLLSVIFDVILAWGCLRLAGLITRSQARQRFVFLAALLLPTVVLNGACWGQCDSVYAALAVWSLYHALARQGIRAMLCIAAAFSVKLQAIFLMPLFLVFLVTGRVKRRHCLAFPIMYVVMVSPALLAGRPFWDTITMYAGQTGTIGSGLNYNSPSIFAVITSEYTYELSLFGIAAAGLFTCGLLCWLICRRRELDDEVLLCAAVLLAVGIPFLLPHMHERYFFLADMLTLVFAVVLPRHFLLPVLTQFASLLGYHAYLRMAYLLPMACGTAALAAVLFFLFGYLSCRLYPKRKRKYT